MWLGGGGLFVSKHKTLKQAITEMLTLHTVMYVLYKSLKVNFYMNAGNSILFINFILL